MREQSSNSHSKHRSHNVSLKKFAGGKSANNRKDKELETQRHQKAAVLRKYAKLCKAEGIQSDRVNMEHKTEKSDKRTEKKKDIPKPAPFRNSLLEAEQRKNDKIASKDEREQKLQKKEELEKTRNEKRKVMLKKTRKGQPIMKNQISAILEKLTKG